MDDDRHDQAEGINDDMPLAAPNFLARIVAEIPPFVPRHLTLWRSVMTAVGLASSPSSSRTALCKASRICSPRTPRSWKSRRMRWTDFHGGRSLDNGRQEQPVRSRYRTALRNFRMSVLRGRPVACRHAFEPAAPSREFSYQGQEFSTPGLGIWRPLRPRPSHRKWRPARGR